MDRNGNERPLVAAVVAERERVGEKVSIYLRGQRWWATYMHEKRQRREPLNTTNKKEARRKAIQIEAKLMDGSLRPKVKLPLIGDVISQYLAYLKVEGRRASTLKRYTPELERIRKFAEDQGVTRLNGISITLLDEYRAWRTKEEAATATLYHECTLFKQLLNFAIRREMLAKSPLATAKLKKPKHDEPVFTLEQVDEILGLSPEPWRAIFEVLAFAGLRIGELSWLTWDDLDLANGFLHIRAKAGWNIKDSENRKIPLHARLVKLFGQMKPSPGWVFKAPAWSKTSNGGQQIAERRALNTLKKILKKLDITEGKLHTFRHFFVVHCLTKGVDPYTVAKWLGHSTLEMVMRYFRLLETDSKRAMEKASAVVVPVSALEKEAGKK